MDGCIVVMLLFVFWEEVMAAPAQRRHESQEEYRFRISSAEEKARIRHRQRVAAGEVPPPEGRGLELTQATSGTSHRPFPLNRKIHHFKALIQSLMLCYGVVR